MYIYVYIYQLLCSLPEAKPINHFPVLLDHTSSPPSSARKLAKWAVPIPAFPGSEGWDGGSGSDEDDESPETGGARCAVVKQQ